MDRELRTHTHKLCALIYACESCSSSRARLERGWKEGAGLEAQTQAPRAHKRERIEKPNRFTNFGRFCLVSAPRAPLSPRTLPHAHTESGPSPARACLLHLGRGETQTTRRPARSLVRCLVVSFPPRPPTRPPQTTRHSPTHGDTTGAHGRLVEATVRHAPPAGRGAATRPARAAPLPPPALAPPPCAPTRTRRPPKTCPPSPPPRRPPWRWRWSCRVASKTRRTTRGWPTRWRGWSG